MAIGFSGSLPQLQCFLVSFILCDVCVENKFFFSSVDGSELWFGQEQEGILS